MQCDKGIALLNEHYAKLEGTIKNEISELVKIRFII